MPHSLYLGSGIVQNRLRDFDEEHNGLEPLPKAKLFAFNDDADSTFSVKYKPSLSAIRSCLNYSIIELAFSLFTFALFVNSAILITAGASLSHLPKEETDDADLFTIHQLLSDSIAPVAGTMFALALLLSGTSAGIVCTIAGQMVSEGQLSWTMKPWVRRLLTRTISITPSIIIAGAVGRQGLSAALEGSQVALSIILPFVSAPLIYFTWSAKVMSVSVHRQDDYNHYNNGTPSQQETTPAPVAILDAPSNAKEEVPATIAEMPRLSLSAEENAESRESIVVMKNGWIVSGIALAIWLLITVMNVALLVLLGLGNKK
jgi:metal iron transporter